MYIYEGVGVLKQTVICGMVHHREAPRNHHNTQKKSSYFAVMLRYSPFNELII